MEQITRTEREDLLRISRLRMKVAKAEAGALAAKRKAEFEQQLAREYTFDEDAIWQQAVALALAATKEANKKIAQQALALGIPREFAPNLSFPVWWDRGQNAVASRRAELTRVAHGKIDQRQREAVQQIERKAAEFQTRILAGTLQSAEAVALLEAMPTVERLMPEISVQEIQQQLLPAGEEEDSDDE
jgi:hypothetical protein